jgi:hypothetical protein
MTSPRAAALTAAGAIVLLFGTPLRALWARDAGPWWLPFAAWAGLIVVVVVAARDRDRA